MIVVRNDDWLRMNERCHINMELTKDKFAMVIVRGNDIGWPRYFSFVDVC